MIPMDETKTKSLRQIEGRMQETDPASLRYRVLDCARRFKTSWIELGQSLVAVQRDKRFREWGYLTFEAYCAKEIGIQQATAMKLLRSYSFLEREEPAYLKKQLSDDAAPPRIPSVDSVNALRLVKSNERIPEREYERLRDDVLETAKEDTDVKKKVRYLLKTHPNPNARTPDDTETREALLKRLSTQLKTARTELGRLETPKKLLDRFDALVDAIDDFVG